MLLFVALLATVLLQVEGLGEVFQGPFKAKVQIRQLCFEPSIYGCDPNDYPGPKHLLETDEDSGLTFVTINEEIIVTDQTNNGPQPKMQTMDSLFSQLAHTY